MCRISSILFLFLVSFLANGTEKPSILLVSCGSSTLKTQTLMSIAKKYIPEIKQYKLGKKSNLLLCWKSETNYKNDFLMASNFQKIELTLMDSESTKVINIIVEKEKPIVEVVNDAFVKLKKQLSNINVNNKPEIDWIMQYSNVQIGSILNNLSFNTISNTNQPIEFEDLIHAYIIKGDYDAVKTLLNYVEFFDGDYPIDNSTMRTRDGKAGLSGNYLIHTAIMSASPKILDLIIEKYPDLSLLTEQGESVYDLLIKHADWQLTNVFFKKVDSGIIPNANEFLLSLIKKEEVADNTYSQANFKKSDYQINAKHQVVKTLLRHGANPNLELIDGYTLLHWAVLQQSPKLTNIVLSAKADVNAVNPKSGLSALHLASFMKSKPLLTLLIEANAELNIQDNQGRTPLFFAFPHPEQALQQSHKSLISYLVDNGANPSLRDYTGLIASESYNKRRSDILITKAKAEEAERIRFMIEQTAMPPGRYNNLTNVKQQSDKIIKHLAGERKPENINLYSTYFESAYNETTSFGVSSSRCKGQKVEPIEEIIQIETQMGNSFTGTVSRKYCGGSYSSPIAGRYKEKYIYIYHLSDKSIRIREYVIENGGRTLRIINSISAGSGVPKRFPSRQNGAQSSENWRFYTTFHQAKPTRDQSSFASRATDARRNDVMDEHQLLVSIAQGTGQLLSEGIRQAGKIENKIIADNNRIYDEQKSYKAKHKQASQKSKQNHDGQVNKYSGLAEESNFVSDTFQKQLEQKYNDSDSSRRTTSRNLIETQNPKESPQDKYIRENMSPAAYAKYKKLRKTSSTESDSSKASLDAANVQRKREYNNDSYSQSSNDASYSNSLINNSSRKTEDKSTKYLWVNSIQTKTTGSESSEEKARTWMKETTGNNALREYCMNSYGGASVPIVTNLKDAIIHKTSSGRYTGTGIVQGYCSVKYSSSGEYAQIPWCSFERSGQANCAIKSAL